MPCGLEYSGFKPRWRQEILSYPHTSRPALGPTPSSAPWVPGQSPRDKAAGAWPWPPPPSSAELWMNTVVTVHPVCSAWRVMGRPLSCIQISRWSLSLQNGPVFEKFLQHVSCCLVCMIRRLSDWNQQLFSWGWSKARTACYVSMYFGGHAVRDTL